MNGIAIVNRASGLVQTIVRDDNGPVTPPDGYDAVPADQLPAGWQREPPPVVPPEDVQLGPVMLRAEDGKLTVPARLVIDGDAQFTDPTRGPMLKDEQGHDWLLVVANGAPALVQVSSSPEVCHDTRCARIDAKRADVRARLAKGKGKVADRLDAIEALLGL